MNTMETVVDTKDVEVKPKRGRKKKEPVESASGDIKDPVEKVPKKRGRKPKGGKLIAMPSTNDNERMSVANIILHLKCSLDDLTYTDEPDSNILRNPTEYIANPPPDVMAYNPPSTSTFAQFGTDIDPDANITAYPIISDVLHNNQENMSCSTCNSNKNNNAADDETDSSMKDIQDKIKQVKIQLYHDSNPDKKAACFWCTYDFDNPTCYIPKHEIDGDLCGYGSFCRPECAVAYLLKENIDDSIKFERYHLLNKLYSVVYNFKQNIKPAPDPHYLLDKFYGNLTIQEYRKLMKTDHMLLIIDKPMTRILPELHENTDDMENTGIHGSKGALTKQSGVYKVKRQSEKQKGPTKSEIMKENFGF
jgi:hypothetical protein